MADQIQPLETHRYWKHVKTGRLAVLFGYGLWMGSVHDKAEDMTDVIVIRPQGMDGFADLSVVPAHFIVDGARTADAAKVQSASELTPGQQLITYQCNGGVWARPISEFFDGRFVKCDAEGNELPPAKKGSKEA
jgi:hypothetical protein